MASDMTDKFLEKIREKMNDERNDDQNLNIAFLQQAISCAMDIFRSNQ